ncbi:MAG TPA: DNA gyrase modulator, partial [Myxococcaceae bacterium]|nr:DNA gyrase modulator [Myxococcaceae bacterium]
MTTQRQKRARRPENRPVRPAAPLLPVGTLERLLSAAMSRGADFAEVYVERGTSTAVILEEKKIKSAQAGLSQGVGV